MPEDCQHRWSKNGSYESQKRGLVQRQVCGKCGQVRKEWERLFSVEMEQALALVALGLPLDQVEGLLGLKSETIKRSLMAAYRIPERWTEVQRELSRLGITDREIELLEEAAYFVSGLHRFDASMGPSGMRNLEKLAQRIESVLGYAVLVGVSRQGVRVCRRQQFNDLLGRIRKFPAERIKTVDVLSERERQFLRRLPQSIAAARFFAPLYATERTVDPPTGRVLPPKLTLHSLAEGARMDVDQFVGTVIGLARKLHRLKK